MWDAEVDVVVAGAGGAGLVAALTAAQAGLQVAVFEKTEHVLGNTAASAGMIPAAGTRFQREFGIEENAEDMAADILQKNQYESDPDLTLALCKASGPLIEWMHDDLGIELSLVTEFKYPGHSNYRMHAPPSRSGLELMKQLRQRVMNVEEIFLMTNSPVTQLLTDEHKAVNGVVVTSNGEEQRIKAKKVILATNGFAGSKQLVEKYIPEIKDALYFGYEANTGEGITMGVDIGAQLANMQGYQGHSAVNEGTGILVTWGTMMMGGFMVNINGERFGNETSGYSEFAVEILRQAEQFAYIIFDQEIYDELMSHEDFKNLAGMNAFKCGETIQQLSNRLNIDGEKLTQTFNDFEKSRLKQEDKFNRTDFAKQLQAPFYGIKVSPALFHTQGGLLINENSQVIHKNGNVIDNLYAAGGTAVGVSGNHAYGYMSGNGLLAAMGFGKIAGDHVVEMLEKQ